MVLFLKWASRTVHHYPEQREEEKNELEGSEELASTISLTVWTKSLLFNCSGFTVIGSDGSLAFRVDNYIGRPDEIVLMDGSGLPIFTLCRRKKLRFVDNYWFVYEGEAGKYKSISSSKKPVYCVKKNIRFGQRKSNVVAYVYCGTTDKRYVYTIEGSYRHRSCKILDESRRVVGEIRKKESKTGGVTFGLEVFHLVVKPGFDSSFAMAIVLLLDQMFT